MALFPDMITNQLLLQLDLLLDVYKYRTLFRYIGNR